MTRKGRRLILTLLTLLSLLAGCGDSGSGDDARPVTGVAVDPYIVGAVFQEMTPGGRLLQTSSPSDRQGRFSFPQPVQSGSIIEMKNDSRGYHAGAPYSGLLKRRVATGETGPLVVSPLTTLLANGASVEEVLDFLQQAALGGMTRQDLLADPMLGLEEAGAGPVTDAALRNLHATLAVNALMHLLNDYTAGASVLATPGNRQLMAALVGAARELLNRERFASLADTLAADPEFADQPLRWSEAILFAAESMQAIAELADGGESPSQSAISRCVGDSLADSAEIVGRHRRSPEGS